MPPSRLSGRPRAVLLAAAVLIALASGAPVAAADEPVPFTESYVPYEPWGERCTGSSTIAGREPAGGGTHPVFVYLTASGGIYNGAEASLFVEAMAARGFVAASVDYDTLFGIEPAALDGKSRCIFDATSEGSAVAALCARPAADCSKGIAVTGFSQGGYLAVRAHNHDPRVRGAYVIGFSDGAMPASHLAILAPWPAGTRSLPSDRLRIVNGSLSDDMGEGEATRRQLDALTEQHCGVAANRCWSPSGSGWYMVQHSEVADGIADHCYFHGGGGCSYTPPFDPGWRPPSTWEWGLQASLDWLETTLGRAPAPPSGLQATYFDDPALTAARISRVDPAIDFDWGLGTPGPAIADGDSFSARWTGTLEAASSEPYTFTLAADDGGRLWLDGELLIDAWHRTSPDPARATVALAAGSAHAFKLEYREDAYGASARLRWSTPTRAEEPIPAAAFTPGPYVPREPSGGPSGGGRPEVAAPRLAVRRRATLRRGRLPVAVTCALACRVRIAASEPGGDRRRRTRRNLAPGTRTVRVRLARALRRAARTRAVRIAVTARIRQGGETHILRARVRARAGVGTR